MMLISDPARCMCVYIYVDCVCLLYMLAGTRTHAHTQASKHARTYNGVQDFHGVERDGAADGLPVGNARVRRC